MKNSMSTLFSVFMIGLGLLSVIWVSSSMVGKAHSQQSGEAGSAASVTNHTPSKTSATMAPTMDLQPPSSGGLPPAPIDMPTLDAPPAQTEAVPIFQNSEGYTYDPTGRRDPFRPFGLLNNIVKVPGPIIPPNEVNRAPPPALTPTEPLQQFDLAQLKVVGIVWEVRNPKAMIRDPLGKLHLVLRESKIGRNNGFVAAIREGEVIVVEPGVSESGMQTASTRVLVLAR